MNLVPGTIIRVTAYWGTSLDSPAWMIVKEPDGVEDFDRVNILIADGFDSFTDAIISSDPGEGDVFEIIPDEDVPDEVWVALAKLRLMGVRS